MIKIILILVTTLCCCQNIESKKEYIVTGNDIEQIFIQGYLSAKISINDTVAIVTDKMIVDMLNKSGRYLNGKKIKIKKGEKNGKFSKSK